RRHTSWPRDWSSDVCSSDLRPILFTLAALRHLEPIARGGRAGGCHHYPDENGSAPLDLCDASADGVARHYYHDRELSENLRCERSEERRVGKEFGYRLQAYT